VKLLFCISFPSENKIVGFLSALLKQTEDHRKKFSESFIVENLLVCPKSSFTALFVISELESF